MAAMTYESLVEAVRKKFKDTDVSWVDGVLAYQFNITGKAEGIFYVEVKDKQLHIEPYNYYDRNAEFTLNGTNLMKLLNGKLNPVDAFTNGKIQVEGDMDKALEIIRFLK